MQWLKTCLLALLLVGSELVSSAQVIQTLYPFVSTNGAHPTGLTLGVDGSLYGTTMYGGVTNSTYAAGMGTVFKITTSGVFTPLAFFGGTNGANPAAGLAVGNDGNFYGTTEFGGDGGTNEGTVFEVTPEGVLTSLVSFAGTNGADPVAGLALGDDGNFYGTTAGGGTNEAGTVFSVSMYGVLTSLFSFAGTNGAYPSGALTLAADGSFYGTAKFGGLTNASAAYGAGTVFDVTTAGTLTTLGYFRYTNAAGGYPMAAVTLGDDGNLYGTTEYGSTQGGGAVFELTTNEVLTNVTYFTSVSGNVPQAPLALGTDGAFYGTTSYGGAYATNGTVFRVTTTGTLTRLVSFAYTNGAYPVAGLTLGADGRFYGTTAYGGSNDCGTVFRLLLPPWISAQPIGVTNVAGAAASFTVGASSLLPFTYQWQKNGTNLEDGGNISGSTNDTLTLASISDSDVAAYSVVLSNADLSVTSSNAILKVIDAPGVAAQPAGFLLPSGSNVTFSVSLSGTAPFRYQWLFNGTNLVSGTNATYTIASVTSNSAGFYSLLVSNLAGSAVSSNAPLDVMVLPKSQTNAAGGTAVFTVAAYGPEPATFQWEENGTNLVDGGNISGSATNDLTIADLSDSDAGSYLVTITNAWGSITSSVINLVVVDPPVMVTQPTNRVVLAGTPASFGATFSGSTNFFHYQWQFNGTNISAATSSSYNITRTTTNQGGNYTLIVTNLAGRAVSSNAALTVVVSPASRTNYASSTAIFTAAAFGPEALVYQWEEDGTNLVDGGNFSGSTNSTLTIANLLDTYAGTYCAVVGDGTSSVTTSNASLAVNDTLYLATQPLSQTIGVGSNVTFSAVAYGAPPFIFQWYYSNSAVGSPISGTNVAFYTLTDVQTNQSGIYRVQVINGQGSLMSSNAVLTVKPFAPNITVQPVGQRVLLGSAASFSVAANGTPPLYYQWKFKGTNILGATNLTYAIPVLAATNTGYYSVVITNVAGSATSSNALLTVLIPPTVAMQFVTGYPVLSLSGMLSNSFVVQYNTNLATTNWITLLSVSNLLSSPYQFLDPAGINQPVRLYRAVMH
jgi:uncharacterized repeat protein (TIGR03803 family)